MGWRSLNDVLAEAREQEYDAMERAQEVARARGRRRAELERHQAALFADEGEQAELAERAESERWPQARDHQLEVVATQRKGWDRMFRARCSCGWKARLSTYTERGAELYWKGHRDRVAS